jgi:hypothetical protein
MSGTANPMCWRRVRSLAASILVALVLGGAAFFFLPWRPAQPPKAATRLPLMLTPAQVAAVFDPAHAATQDAMIPAVLEKPDNLGLSTMPADRAAE